MRIDIFVCQLHEINHFVEKLYYAIFLVIQIIDQFFMCINDHTI